MLKQRRKTEKLRRQLEQGGVDLSKWGVGEARTLKDLQRSMNKNESVLVKGAKGRLLRKVMIVDAAIYHVNDDGKKYYLVEKKQVLSDGRERQRDHGYSVAEKAFVGEDPLTAIIRGIREELGIRGPINPVQIWKVERKVFSKSYPGLLTHYVGYGFEVFLNKKQFNPNGYVEEQDDKSTYFVWEEA
jgi:hypothetical protein